MKSRVLYFKEDKCMKVFVKRLMTFYIVAVLLIGNMFIQNVYAKKKKYVKKFSVSKNEITIEEGKTKKVKYKIKVYKKASKKIKVKSLNKKIVKVTVKKNYVYIYALKKGKTAIELKTKGKNNRGKVIKRKIWVTVEPKEKNLVDFATYAESGYIYAGYNYKYLMAGGESDDKYTDNLGNTYNNGINYRLPNFSLEESYIEYRVDEYNYLKGRVILNFATRSCEDSGYLIIYGDGEKIYESKAVKKGVDPFDIKLDISGVRVLRIEFSGCVENVSLVNPVVWK